jgi:predicted nucleic acid-binding protein
MTEITRIVADADVLAADLLVGGAARDSLDVVRAHSWIELVASDALLADAEAVIATLADDELTTDWREMIETERVAVDHPPEDHPALASAYQGEAVHVLSLDERLQSAKAGVTLREHMDASIKHPDAFVRLFDAERLYETVFDEPYPGPDRDPRA